MTVRSPPGALSLFTSTIALLACGSGCISRGTFSCADERQCGEGGRCEPSGFCSYPDERCNSGFRYGAFALEPGACTDPDADVHTETSTTAPDTTETTSDASEGSGVDSDGGTPNGPVEPIPGDLCGNGVLDDGEICDDGNRIPDDGCNAYCIEDGGTIWERTFDSEYHLEDRAFGVALAPDGETFAITGPSEVPGHGWDILVQLYEVHSGELLWTDTHGGNASRNDSGEHIAFDSAGDIIVGGYEQNSGTNGDIWLRKYRQNGEVMWTRRLDIEGGDDKAHSVAVAPDGTIVVAGHAGRLTGEQWHTDVWVGRFSAAGVLSRVVTSFDGGSELDDEALDVRVGPEGRVYVTGMVRIADGTDSVWTAVYDSDDALVWSDTHTHDEVRSYWDRGVGIEVHPSGRSLVSGTVGRDIWLREYGPNGEIEHTEVVDGVRSLHDEGAASAYYLDGSFVSVGFTDYATEGFARGFIWLRRYAPDWTPRWTVQFEGPAKEIDKALSVVDVGDGSVIAVGYITVPGQLRDVWLRKVAI